jgi:hypothetical protein
VSWVRNTRTVPTPSNNTVSVADLGCLSRFWILIFTHPGSRIQKERGEKKICYHTIFCSHKFHKIEFYFIFEMPKKISASLQRIIEVFSQKIFTKLSKIWVWDPRSGIRDLRSGIRIKAYSGSRIQGSKRHWIPDPGSGSATLVTVIDISIKEIWLITTQFNWLSDGGGTLQLLLHLQIHHYRGHGCGQVLPPPPVHREKM